MHYRKEGVSFRGSQANAHSGKASKETPTVILDVQHALARVDPATYRKDR